MATKRKKPWKRPSPKKKTTHLTPARKAAAKRRAKKAGRPYPNLVDNMHEASAAPKKKKKKKKRQSARPQSKKRRATRKKSMKR